jgi:hypothetical protein
MGQEKLKPPAFDPATGPRRFELAPMARSFMRITVIYSVLAVALIFGNFHPLARGVGGVLTAIAVLVWAWFRPSHLELSGQGLSLVWPYRRRTIALQDLVSAELVATRDFGWMLRIGVGGVGGAFGLFYTSTHGLIDGYFTAHESLVLLKLRQGRPLLLSPKDPAAFIAALGLAA